MFLKRVALQNFRNYAKSEFLFNNGINLIVGPNTSGKSNLIESIFLLSYGKSFRSEKDVGLILFEKEIARVEGEVYLDLAGKDRIELEIVITSSPSKKFLVNGVSKRRIDFAGQFLTVVFSPLDLEIVIASPRFRRIFLDEVLEQVDREYRLSLLEYTKALRQRNALLEKAREKGVKNEKLFEYWDKILIKNGEIITKKRGAFVDFVNNASKEVFDFAFVYDKSVISHERLLQYKDAEVGAGVTLVGPHRDDFSFHMFDNVRQITHDLKVFGSRGQQRLVVLQLKLLQILFIEKILDERPILLLDDIFSELDDGHIKLVLDMVKGQQTIITTTHKEFVDRALFKNMNVIELKKT